MKICVTGASGFLGQYVIAELQKHDCSITATYNKSNLQALEVINQDKTQWKQLDLYELPEEIFSYLNKPDILIHLAWSGLPNYRSNHHFENELPPQYKFLKTMVEQGLDSMLVVGTCFEYGMQSGPLSEELETKPDNPYGFAKDSLRKQLEFLKREKTFKLIWSRLFYMYGEGQADSSLYSQFIKAVENKDEIFNMSGGEQLRDFLPVEDIAKNISQLAFSKMDAGIVNVCSGIPISVRSLVESWKEQFGSSIKLNLGFYPYPDYEPMAFWGDAKKINKITETA